MKTLLSKILYYLGNITYKLNLYRPYLWFMKKSVKLDLNYKVWQKTKEIDD
jgi:hypothetical protein